MLGAGWALGGKVRSARWIQSAAAIVCVATPVSLLETPARAADRLSVQVGIGSGVSVVLGKKPEGQKRVGGEFHLFGEAVPSNRTQRGAFGFSIGGTVGLRTMGPAGPQLDVAARLGPTRIAPTSWPSHTTLGTARAVLGVGIPLREGPPDVLIGVNARTVLANLTLLQEWATRDGGTPQWTLDTGLELGLVPGLVYVDGRPLRDAGPARLPDVDVDGPVLGAAAEWLRSGREELAAVAAFVSLADELAALGAPSRLIQRALHAADEEVVHAMLCLGRAAELSGRRIVARPLRPRARHLQSREAALARIATESWADGYLNEGAAAERATVEASAARNDVDARIHERIADDESTHAILGRDIAVWAAA